MACWRNLHGRWIPNCAFNNMVDSWSAEVGVRSIHASGSVVQLESLLGDEDGKETMEWLEGEV